MSVFLYENTVTERDFVAGENGPFDLPVNPVSCLLLHFRAEVGVAAPDFQQLLGHIQSVSVTFKGTQIVNMSGVDLARMVHHLWGKQLNIEGFDTAAPSLVSFTLPIPFSRKPFWPMECFPATRRGEFTLSVVRSAALTNIVAPRIAVESLSLLEADPKQFLKMVSISRTISVGDADFELPIGNPFLGLQIFSPVAMGAVPISETVRRVRLLMDHVEYNYADAAFDILRSVGHWRASDINSYSAVGSNARNYVYMDFDPLMDETYAVVTEGRASVRLRMVPDVTGIVRVAPVELVKFAG